MSEVSFFDIPAPLRSIIWRRVRFVNTRQRIRHLLERCRPKYLANELAMPVRITQNKVLTLRRKVHLSGWRRKISGHWEPLIEVEYGRTFVDIETYGSVEVELLEILNDHEVILLYSTRRLKRWFSAIGDESTFHLNQNAKYIGFLEPSADQHFAALQYEIAKPNEVTHVKRL